MLLIKYVMNIIKNKYFENKDFPNSFILMSDTYSVRNTIRFFFFCIYYLRISGEITTPSDSLLNKDEIEHVYLKAKNTLSVLSRFIRKYKFKKYKKYEYDSDLNFIPLSKYKDCEKIKIIQNKTVYNFKLKDLINLWKISLKKSDHMFPSPTKLKNPFTNIEFNKNQLYNIYFKYGFGKNNIVSDVLFDFFKSNFEIGTYKMISYEKLQLNAINQYTKNAPVTQLYDYLVMIFYNYRKDIDYIFFKDQLSIFDKLSIIKKFNKYIKYYLITKYNCNPIRKEYYSKCISSQLKSDISLYDPTVFVFLTTEQVNRYITIGDGNISDIEDDDQTDDQEDDPDDPDDVVIRFSHNNRNQTTTNSTTTNNSTFRRSNTNTNTIRNNSYSTTSRRSSYPRTFPQMIINTYENYNNNQNDTNPFSPSTELPRTPVNNVNVNNSISERFNLGFR